MPRYDCLPFDWPHLLATGLASSEAIDFAVHDVSGAGLPACSCSEHSYRISQGDSYLGVLLPYSGECLRLFHLPLFSSSVVDVSGVSSPTARLLSETA